MSRICNFVSYLPVTPTIGQHVWAKCKSKSGGPPYMQAWPYTTDMTTEFTYRICLPQNLKYSKPLHGLMQSHILQYPSTGLHTAAIRTDEFNMNSVGLRVSFKATRLKWNINNTNLISQRVSGCLWKGSHYKWGNSNSKGQPVEEIQNYQMEWTEHVDWMEYYRLLYKMLTYKTYCHHPLWKPMKISRAQFWIALERGL